MYDSNTTKAKPTHHIASVKKMALIDALWFCKTHFYKPKSYEQRHIVILLDSQKVISVACRCTCSNCKKWGNSFLLVNFPDPFMNAWFLKNIPKFIALPMGVVTLTVFPMISIDVPYSGPVLEWMSYHLIIWFQCKCWSKTTASFK